MSALPAAPADPRPDALFLHLRERTRRPHEHLEDVLDLLTPPLSRTRFASVLDRFASFHASWEPAVARHEALAPILAGRSRLALVRRDLERLDARHDARADCADAAGLTDTLPRAIGSLYVMEGSTLGGQVISRALAGVDWLPAGGLSYFSPYGGDAGRRWRDLKAALEPLAPHAAWAEVTAGAVDTFALLARWHAG